MALDLDRLLAYAIPQTRMTLSTRDTILYALGIGYGAAPTAAHDLRFTYERDLVACPSMATILAAPHAWIRKANIGFDGSSVHAGIGFRLHRPIPVAGDFHSDNSVAEVIDKGPGGHALIATRRVVSETQSDVPLLEILSTSMLLREGGFGGSRSGRAAQSRPLPERPPDIFTETQTLPQQALIYRLSGDYNPLHADPETAKQAGYHRPILHGLCTYGIACRMLIAKLCPDDPARLTGMDARFSKPVFPGDTLRMDIWTDSTCKASFRCTVPARRGAIVLDQGRVWVTRQQDEAL